MTKATPDNSQQSGGVSRRDFLRVGGLSVVSLSVAEQAAQARKQAAVSGCRSCIFILMTGGPSQFETFDPKPAAPQEIRGPLHAISTAIPGTQLSECLPQLAARADKFTILRSLCHDAAPIHETGLQLLQTGRLARGDVRHPAYGSVVARFLGPRNEIAPYVALPRLLSETGVNAYQGQEAGFLGHDFDPLTGPHRSSANSEEMASFVPGGFLAEETEKTQATYGKTRFGRLCLQARKLVECGVRCVTVNLFDTLAGEKTWDCHGRSTTDSSNLYDYRDRLGPEFDRALSALLDDLGQRGLLDETLVIAAGEFGRTPRINEYGGRDHWPGVWSAIVAGGGVQGGRVIGGSDAHGAAPSDRPTAPGELTATIYNRLGLDDDLKLCVDDETFLPLVDHQPIGELFA
jgi:uncharacterized protein (DUF1501 family)